MRKTLWCVMLLGLNLFGSEREIHSLILRQNDQIIGCIFAISAVGLHKLVQNADQICSIDDPYCWKVVAPMVAIPFLGGYLLYKRFIPQRGKT